MAVGAILRMAWSDDSEEKYVLIHCVSMKCIQWTILDIQHFLSFRLFPELCRNWPVSKKVLIPNPARCIKHVLTPSFTSSFSSLEQVLNMAYQQSTSAIAQNNVQNGNDSLSLARMGFLIAYTAMKDKYVKNGDENSSYFLDDLQLLVVKLESIIDTHNQGISVYLSDSDYDMYDTVVSCVLLMVLKSHIPVTNTPDALNYLTDCENRSSE